MVIVLCTLYIPSLLLILKTLPSTSLLETVNFSWSFVPAIIPHYCRIWNSDFARNMFFPLPISFWKPRFFAYAHHFHITSKFLYYFFTFTFNLLIPSSIFGKNNVDRYQITYPYSSVFFFFIFSSPVQTMCFPNQSTFTTLFSSLPVAMLLTGLCLNFYIALF